MYECTCLHPPVPILLASMVNRLLNHTVITPTVDEVMVFNQRKRFRRWKSPRITCNVFL